MNYIIAIITNDNKIGYFTGNAINTLKTKAKLFANLKTANSIRVKIAKNSYVKNSVVISKSVIRSTLLKKLTVKNNPIKDTKSRKIKKAIKLYEDFTGMEYDTYDKVNMKDYDVGLKVGKCLGIMYETIRDGTTERYLHEFKTTSRPDFCISHDGHQIFLVNGNYKFMDTGINDI